MRGTLSGTHQTGCRGAASRPAPTIAVPQFPTKGPSVTALNSPDDARRYAYIPPDLEVLFMDNTIAIVQPCELMSVAEQKYVLAEYAKDAGVTIDRFFGEDDILRAESPCFEMLMRSISTGDTSHILMLDGIAANLPQGLFDNCGASGGKIHLVDSHKGLRLAG